MSQVIRAQYRAVIQKEAVPEKTEQAFAYWEEQLKKQCLEGGVLTGTMCRYQDQLFLYLECIAAEEQLADSRRWKAKIENFAQNILGNQDVLEMWPVFDVSGEHKTSETGRFWVYMYPVFWFDEPKSLDTWREHRNRMGGADGLRCCTLKSYFPMYATIRQSLRKACWWEIAIR